MKKVLYRFMEDYRCKYTHKVHQFVAVLNSGKNCSTDLKPNGVKNSEFFSIPHVKPPREYKKKTKFKFAVRARISTCDLPFRKVYKRQFTQKIFEIVAIGTRKPPTYTIKDVQNEILRGKLYQIVLTKFTYQ